MNMNGNLALAVQEISIGAVSVMAVHAQEAKTPPAYLIAETEVTDRAAFQKYAEKVPETLAPFRGSFHYVVRGEVSKRVHRLDQINAFKTATRSETATSS